MDEFTTVDIAGADGQQAANETGDGLGSPPTESVPAIEKSPEEYQKMITGLTTGIQEEREQRQNLTGQVSQLQQQLNYVTQLQTRQQELAAAPPEDEYDDDYVSKKDMRDGNKQLESQLQQGFATLVNMSQEVARLKHDDYDEALSYFEKSIVNNPRLLEQVRSSPNPAIEAYNIGRQHPEYFNKVLENHTKKVADRVNQNMGHPSTLTNTGAANTSDEAFRSRVNQMSLEDINNELDKTIRGIKG